MVGPAMYHFLDEVGANARETSPWEIVIQTSPEEDVREWRMGVARPVQALDARQGAILPMPPGRLIARRETVRMAGIPTVTAQSPWSILVRFWWRAPDTSVEWPGYRVDWLGVHHKDLAGADWILDRAIQPPPEAAPDPGDATWGDTVGPIASDAVRRATRIGGTGVVIVAGIALGIFLATRFRRSKR